ncbi:Uncharacterised protein [Mycobacterium tuberculosis]|nr:Uncharacterised protein [Mycobacterium tuberculosis]COY27487.1 Uncharacterised protein [Mycobacterium tuberculosis]
MSVEMAMFEVDACRLGGLRGEADFDLTGLGQIGFRPPSRADIPRE